MTKKLNITMNKIIMKLITLQLISYYLEISCRLYMNYVSITKLRTNINENGLLLVFTELL